MQGIEQRSAAALGRVCAASVRHARAVVLLAFVLAVASVAFAVRNLPIDANTTDLINPDLPFRQLAIDYERQFPVQRDVIVAVIDGRTTEDAIAAANALAGELAQRGDRLEDIQNPAADPFLRSHALLFLGPDRLDALATDLAGAQPFLTSLAAEPTTVALADVLQLAARSADTAQPDLARFVDRLATLLGDRAAGADARLSWLDLAGGEGLNRLGARRLVLARPAASAVSTRGLGGARPAIDAVREAIAALPPALAERVTVRLTGNPVLRQQELRSVATGAGIASVLSLVLVAGLLILGVPSLRMIAAILATVIIGLALTAGLAALGVGRLNLISAAFAVLFLGLAVDFGIHIGLRAFEPGLGDGARETIADRLHRAIVGVGPGILLSTICAGIGFFAFAFTDYRGLSELGIIAGLGMIVAFVTSVTLFPALLSLWPPGGWRADRAPGAGRGRARGRLAPSLSDRLRLDGLTAAVRRRPRLVLVLAGCLTGLGLIALPHLAVDANPLNLQDPALEAVSTYRDLAREPLTSPYVANVLVPDLATAEALAQRLRAIPEVAGVRTVSSFVPPDQDERLGRIDDMALLLGPLLDIVPEPVAPDAAANRAALLALDAAIAEAEANGGMPQPQAAAFARLRPAIASILRRPAAEIAALDAALVGTLPVFLEQLRTALSVTEPVRMDMLPPSLLRDWVAPDGRVRVEIRPQRDIGGSAAALAAFAEPVAAVAPQATGAAITLVGAARTMLDAFLTALSITLAAMTLVILAVSRSVRVLALVLCPLALAAVWTGASSVMLGLDLNFANVIVIPLLFALGVTSSIHMVLRHRHEAAAGAKGPTAGAALAGSSTPAAVLWSALTTIASFGTLALSDHLGMSSLGTLHAIALVQTIIVTLVVLPAVMAILDRRQAAGSA